MNSQNIIREIRDRQNSPVSMRKYIDDIVMYVMARKDAYKNEETLEADLYTFVSGIMSAIYMDNQIAMDERVLTEVKRSKDVLLSIKDGVDAVMDYTSRPQKYRRDVLYDYDYKFKGPKKSKYRQFILDQVEYYAK